MPCPVLFYCTVDHSKILPGLSSHPCSCVRKLDGSLFETGGGSMSRSQEHLRSKRNCPSLRRMRINVTNGDRSDPFDTTSTRVKTTQPSGLFPTPPASFLVPRSTRYTPALGHLLAFALPAASICNEKFNRNIGVCCTSARIPHH